MLKQEVISVLEPLHKINCRIVFAFLSIAILNSREDFDKGGYFIVVTFVGFYDDYKNH